jgi:hypothetical protein
MQIEEFDNISTFEYRTPFYKYCVESRRLKGLNLEFGVFNGGTIKILSKMLRNEIIWGFDSFEGLPEEWYFGESNHVKGYFKLTEVPKVNSNVKLVKGWFKDSIPEWKKEHKGEISLLHIDSDLYSSCKTILDELNDQIVEGTIIIFDELSDWATEIRYTNWRDGEWKALNEWLKEKDRKVEAIARTVRNQAAVGVII